MKRWYALAAAVLLLAAAGFGSTALYARGLVRFNYPSRDRYPVWGLDVSHHQGTIDWPAVKRTGQVTFVYIKATEGGDWVDPRFASNWARARAEGFTVGAYHFFTFCRSAEEQAANFVRVVPVESDALPPVLDLEFGGNCRRRPQVDEVRREIEGWQERVTARFGRRPLLYVTYEFLEAYLQDTPPPGEVWIRDIFMSPRVPRWQLWQFANRGHITGVRGPVDLNVFHGDLGAWQALRRAGDSGPKNP